MSMPTAPSTQACSELVQACKALLEALEYRWRHRYDLSKPVEYRTDAEEIAIRQAKAAIAKAERCS